jgi:hypothetical protein
VKKLLLGLLLLNFIVLSAEPITWYSGSLVLNSGEVIVGEFFASTRYDMVLYRAEGHVNVYPAHKIRSIHYYDPLNNINRKFMSSQHDGPGYRLYEIVLTGEISILRKQNRATHTTEEDVESFDYYIYNSRGFYELSQFRGKLYAFIKAQLGEELLAYIKENKLKINEKDDAIRIIAFYNHCSVNRVMARY